MRMELVEFAAVKGLMFPQPLFVSNAAGIEVELLIQA